MSVRTIKLFTDVHMGLGHTGLAILAEKANLRVANIKPNECLMFLNSKKDKLKIMGVRGVVLGYLRMPHGNRIDLDALQYLPQTFGSQGMDYPAALRKALLNKLK